MATVQITAKEFIETVKRGGIVVLNWWAPWCGTCHDFGPIYERTAAANPDVVFGTVNIEEERTLAEQFNISSLPTLMVIRDRVMLFSDPRALPERVLSILLEEVKKLDMDAILRGPPNIARNRAVE